MSDKEESNGDITLQDVIIHIQGVKGAIKANATAIKNIELSMNHRFDKVDQGFNEVDQRFNEVDQRFNEVDQRFNEVDQRFNEVDQRFDAIDEDILALGMDVIAIKNHVGMPVVAD